MNIILSLTSIPVRFEHPSFHAHLVQLYQSMDTYWWDGEKNTPPCFLLLLLTINERYRRFPTFQLTDAHRSRFRQWENESNHRLKIHTTVHDDGPLGKVLGALEYYYDDPKTMMEDDTSVIIISLDDDCHYDMASLLRYHQEAYQSDPALETCFVSQENILTFHPLRFACERGLQCTADHGEAVRYYGWLTYSFRYVSSSSKNPWKQWKTFLQWALEKVDSRLFYHDDAVVTAFVHFSQMRSRSLCFNPFDLTNHSSFLCGLLDHESPLHHLFDSKTDQCRHYLLNTLLKVLPQKKELLCFSPPRPKTI